MRKKKEPTFAYGIEITKPHSKEMYDHNNMVAKEMKTNILNKWEALLNDLGHIGMDDDWTVICSSFDIVKLQKLVCFSGYGDGYTIGDVDKEFRRELDMMQNYSIHEEYSYGSFERLLPRTKYMMIGFDWAKHDYGTELINDPHVKVVNKVVDRLMKDSI